MLVELLNRLTLLLPWTTAPLALLGVGFLAIPSAIGIVVLVAPLLYFLGYRKALSPFETRSRRSKRSGKQDQFHA